MKRRITIDLDKSSVYRCLWAALKGSVYCKSFPEIRMTQRGWHLIWFTDKAKDNNDVLRFRERIGDDPKRIALDDRSDKKLHQVLFSQGAKNITTIGNMPGAWFSIIGKKSISPYFDTCPCGKKIDVATSFWDRLDDRYCIEVRHGDSSCEFPLRHGVPLLLRRCVGLN